MVGTKQEVRTCIYYKKTKLLFLVAIAVVFILEGFWLIDMSNWPGAFAPVSLRVIAILLISFFALPFFIYGAKLFRHSPAYIIKPEGFVDSASLVKHTFVHWDNVKGLEIYTQKVTGFLRYQMNTKYVKVKMKNADAYVDKFTGLPRWFLRFNQQRYKSPILLSTTGMQITPKELFRLLEKSLVDYHHQKMQH